MWWEAANSIWLTGLGFQGVITRVQLDNGRRPPAVADEFSAPDFASGRPESLLRGVSRSSGGESLQFISPRRAARALSR